MITTIGLALAALAAATLYEVLTICRHLTALSSHPAAGLCGNCRHMQDEVDHTHGRAGLALYVADLTLGWPGYRTRQALEALRVVPVEPEHDGPCALADARQARRPNPA